MRHVTHSEDVYEEQETQEADGAVGRDSKHRVAEPRSGSQASQATTGSIWLSSLALARMFSHHANDDVFLDPDNEIDLALVWLLALARWQ